MAVWSSPALSEIQANFGRFDAEFHRPEFLHTQAVLDRFPTTKLRDIAVKIDVGHVGSMVSYYAEEGVRLLQTQSVKSFFVDAERAVRITPEFHARLRKSQVKKGDLLIARSGSFGRASIYLDEEPANSADIIIVEVQEGAVQPLFLLAFMNSRHGSAQLVRFASGGVQGHVNLTILESFRVPKLNESVQKQVAAEVGAAYAARVASDEAYDNASNMLAEALGLRDWSDDAPTSFSSSISSLEHDRRFDAQHFQPKFGRLLQHLARFRCERLQRLVSVNRRGAQPVYAEDGTVRVVNSQHLGPRHVAYDDLDATTGEALAASPYASIRQDDVLIYATGAYVGRANIYLDEQVALASNHVNILRCRDLVDPAYLCMVLQGKVGRYQTEMHARGSAQAELYSADLGRFVIPVLNASVQSSIGDAVRDSLGRARAAAAHQKRALELVDEAMDAGGHA